MGLLNSIRALFPSYKWCGCKSTADTTYSYQFRVRHDEESDNELFQIREKAVCDSCDDEEISPLIEHNCQYEPKVLSHDRQVLPDDDEMAMHGFVPESEMIYMLAEMRLSNTLDLE